MELFSSVLLLVFVFLFGLGVGYRLTILGLQSWINEVEEKDRYERLKELTGYKK